VNRCAEKVETCPSPLGGAKRGKDQLDKDKAMETAGVPVGKNAPDILRGQKIPIKTEEMRY